MPPANKVSLSRQVLMDAFRLMGISVEHINRITPGALKLLDSGELDAEMQKVIDEQGYQAVVALTVKHFAWAARLKN